MEKLEEIVPAGIKTKNPQLKRILKEVVVSENRNLNDCSNYTDWGAYSDWGAYYDEAV